MWRQATFLILGLTILFMAPLSGQSPVPGRNSPVIRGQRQDVYFYPAAPGGNSPNGKVLFGKVLFAPGDGGWRGFAISIATNIASWGYDVYGLDTRRYLESFTGTATLKETDIMSDFRQIAQWITRNTAAPVTLAGWSEGAGLCLLAAASEENKKLFSGLITLGLGESSILGWRWVDAITYITKKDPKEPVFPSLPYLPKVAPLPLLMVQSSRDEYVPLESARNLFSAARQPKRFSLIQAQDHRFDGNTEELFRTLREGLQWIYNMPR